MLHVAYLSCMSSRAFAGWVVAPTCFLVVCRGVAGPCTLRLSCFGLGCLKLSNLVPQCRGLCLRAFGCLLGVCCGQHRPLECPGWLTCPAICAHVSIGWVVAHNGFVGVSRVVAGCHWTWLSCFVLGCFNLSYHVLVGCAVAPSG